MKISDLPVGTRIYDKSGLSFLIAEHDSKDYQGTVLISEKVVAMMPLDSPKEQYTDKERQKFGSNDFSASDLHRWLNAEDGFLKSVSEELKKGILTSSVPYSGMKEEVSCYEARVFVPSVSELGLSVDDHVKEGSQLKLFKEFRNRYAVPTKELVAKRPPNFAVLDANDTWCYWLRSSHTKHGCEQYVSHSHSPYTFCEAFRDYVGVRVMLAADNNLEINEKGEIE